MTNKIMKDAGDPAMTRKNKKNWPVLFAAGLGLFFAAACEKNSASGSNKSWVSITHASPHTESFDVLLAGNKLTESGQISYGTTTGDTTNPYLAGIAGTHNFRISPGGTTYYIDGNIAFLVNNYYSVFIYDTLISGKLKALVLQDELPVLIDTVSALRFINLAKDTSALEVIMTNAKDTVGIGTIPYVGDSPDPSSLSPFRLIRSGSYRIYLGVDTTLLFSDSLTFTGGKTYTIYTDGFLHASPMLPTSVPLGVKLIQHN